MSLIHRSPEGSAFADSRGFIEIVFNEHVSLTLKSYTRIFDAAARGGHRHVKLLISRINEYGVFADFNVADLDHLGPVRLDKVAIYAPSPGDQNFSNLLRITALRRVPCRIFPSRQNAIQWLLDDSDPGAPACP